MNLADTTLDAEAYPGGIVDAAQAGTRFVTRATFDGVIAAANAERETLRGVLPRCLRLASPDDAEHHPIVLIFGHQSHGGSLYGGVQLDWGTRYAEMMVIVPFVTVQRTGHLCNLALAILSSYELPNWVGRVAYGYPKRFGEPERFGPIHTFSTPESGLAFQASVAELGPWCPSAELRDAGRRLARLAALPWLGRKESGLFVRSFSRWRFDDARLREVEARAVLDPSLVPGLGGATLCSTPHGAFEVQGLDWSLSWPRSVVV